MFCYLVCCLKGCVYYATPFYSSRSFFKIFDLAHSHYFRLLVADAVSVDAHYRHFKFYCKCLLLFFFCLCFFWSKCIQSILKLDVLYQIVVFIYLYKLYCLTLKESVIIKLIYKVCSIHSKCCIQIITNLRFCFYLFW